MYEEWETQRTPLCVTIFLSLKEPVKYSSLVWWYAVIMVATTTVLMHSDVYILDVKKWIAYFVNVLNHNENKVEALFFFNWKRCIFILIYPYTFISVYISNFFIFRRMKKKDVCKRTHLLRILSFVSSSTYSSSCIIICSTIRHCIWRILSFITRCTIHVYMSVKIKEKGFVSSSCTIV